VLFVANTRSESTPPPGRAFCKALETFASTGTPACGVHVASGAVEAGLLLQVKVVSPQALSGTTATACVPGMDTDVGTSFRTAATTLPGSPATSKRK
jgi:hypothetical protein